MKYSEKVVQNDYEWTRREPDKLERIKRQEATAIELADAVKQYVNLKIDEGEHPLDVLLNASAIIELYLEVNL